MRPRMVDVAERAGVSIATVSRVLNKTKHVEPPIAAAVWRAIEELGFSPNQHARFLSSGKSNVIGVVMPPSEESGLSRFLHALSGELRAHDHDAMIALSDGNRGGERALVQTLLQSHVSAMVVVAPWIDGKLRTLLRDSDVPAVLAFNEDAGSRIPVVAVDDTAAAESLAAAVPQRPGSVAVLSHGKHETSIKRRVEGFQRITLNRYGTEPAIRFCDGSMDDAYQRARELMTTVHPTLIHTTSDFVAIAAIRAAYDLGRTVPEDVAITGFGVNHYTFTATPALTTVEFDDREVGRLCGSAAIALLNGERVPSVQRVSYRIVAGESCLVEVAH